MVRVIVIMCLLSLCSFIQKGSTTESVQYVCKAVSAEVSIERTEANLQLRITLFNNSAQNVRFDNWALYENGIDLRAKDLSSGVAIDRSIPLISPGASDILIAPGETYSASYDLYTSFSTLREVLGRSDVEISVSFKLEHESNCFRTAITSSILLKK